MNKQARQGAPQFGASKKASTAAATGVRMTTFAKAVAKNSHAKKAAASGNA